MYRYLSDNPGDRLRQPSEGTVACQDSPLSSLLLTPIPKFDPLQSVTQQPQLAI